MSEVDDQFSLSKCPAAGKDHRMYMNVFRSRKRADMDVSAYKNDAERMAELARAQPGFVSYKSYTAEDGETVTISEWDSRADAQAWAAHFDHRAVQNRGRSEYYECYTVYSCDQPEVRRYTNGGVSGGLE